MCLGIREHEGSSEAEWNEEPGAYVLKSQLSQAHCLCFIKVKMLERREFALTVYTHKYSSRRRLSYLRVYYTDFVMMSITPT